MDLLQSRYGWPDHYLINEPGQSEPYIPYARWAELLETVCKARAREFKEQMKIAAFIGWQSLPSTPRNPAPDLYEYWQRMNLGEERNRTAEEDLEAAMEMMKQFGIEV